MKKLLAVLFVLFTVSAGCLFADSASTDPFDSLVEKLLKDFTDDGATVAVKVFTSDLGNNERKKISKSVQFSLYCTDLLEVVSKSDEADYICTGKIESDGPNYIISAKLVDNYDDTVIGNLFTLNVLAFVGWRLGVLICFVVDVLAVCFVGC